MMPLLFETDESATSKAAFGVIVLETDETIEAEFRTVFNTDGIALYHSRIHNATDVTLETLQAMADEMPKSAALFPKARPLDVVAYACTSGATTIGPEKVGQLIATHHPKAKSTDPISAVIAACRHLGLSRIGLLTPYMPAVSEKMQDLLRVNGFEVTAFGSFEQEDDSVVARISPQSILEAACEVGSDKNVDGVFAACTNLRCFGVIDEIEKRLGKPLITSNQALAWHMLTLAGLPTTGMGPGRLFNT